MIPLKTAMITPTKNNPTNISPIMLFILTNNFIFEYRRLKACISQTLFRNYRRRFLSSNSASPLSELTYPKHVASTGIAIVGMDSVRIHTPENYKQRASDSSFPSELVPASRISYKVFSIIWHLVRDEKSACQLTSHLRKEPRTKPLKVDTKLFRFNGIYIVSNASIMST